ncbi:MAG: sigma-70 family RNA polymerase sigma factor [Bacteroidetes bacterium]|nr:sigma-70 family RNA polymerase sigma factor [Bacteroidota bacterium]
MFGYKEKEIVEGLIKEDPRMIKFIYKKYYSSVRSMVLRFNNLILEPEDVFQEGITRTIIIIRNGKFKEQSTLYTFLYGICRNICLKEINKNEKYVSVNDDFKDEIEPENNFEQLQRLLTLKAKMDEGCRKIINLRFGIDQEQEGNRNKYMKFDEIARILEIKVDNARQRFKRCLEKLRKEIKSDPILKADWNI